MTPANLTILGAEAGDWVALASSQQYDSLSRARVGEGGGYRRGMGHDLSTPRALEGKDRRATKSVNPLTNK